MRQYKLSKLRYVQSLHFTADGSRLLAVGGPLVRTVGRAVWLDLATGRNVGYIGRFAACAAVDPAVTRYAVAGSVEYAPPVAGVEWTSLDGEVKWQTFRPEGRKKAPEFDEVSALAFDPTGKRLAVSHNPVGKPELCVVDSETGEQVAHVKTDSLWGVVAFNAGGSRVAVTGGVDGCTQVHVYALGPKANKGPLSVYDFVHTVTRCVLFLPGDRLAVANGRNVYVLPSDYDEATDFALTGHPKQVNAVAVTPDGTRLLTASHDGSIRTWDANTGEPGPAFDWGIGAVTAIAFAPDGLTCAAAGLGGKVVVWDVDA